MSAPICTTYSGVICVFFGILHLFSTGETQEVNGLNIFHWMYSFTDEIPAIYSLTWTYVVEMDREQMQSTSSGFSDLEADADSDYYGTSDWLEESDFYFYY